MFMVFSLPVGVLHRRIAPFAEDQDRRADALRRIEYAP
jgi:hypothetical protein